MNIESIKNNIPGTILKFAIPSVIAMILTSLITVIDGFFIGNYVGSNGIAAVNLGLPLLYVFLAIGIMIGVGGSSISIRLLGAKQLDKSNKVFNQTISSTIISLLIVSALMYLIINFVIKVFDVDQLVESYFKSYYLVMFLVYPVMMLNINLGMYIRAEGKPEKFMSITVLTVVMNIVLDYLFVAVFHMGITGIAFASLLSVLTGLLLMTAYFRNSSLYFKFKKSSFSKDVFRDTYFNGFSELIGQLSMSITMFAFNVVILREVGINGVAAFTIAGYISYLFSMIVIGFGQGASPVIGFSFGAGNFELSKKVRRFTNIFVFILGIAVFIILHFTSESYSKLFVDNSVVQEMVVKGISIFALAFIFLGINTISSFYFTSIGRAKESAVISASRGLVILLACIFILPAIWGMIGVWLVAPVTEVLTILLSLFLLFKHDKKLMI